MSAKELGQIHTVNIKSELPNGTLPTDFVVTDIDLPGELTQQLSRMVRAGNMFKVCGIDMTISSRGNTSSSGSVSGYLRYYAPTRGRCQAFRDAFKTMAEQMNQQGITMRNNKLYDFRVPINEIKEADFRNQATLDGLNGLSLTNSVGGESIFGVHNSAVKPVYQGTTGDLFPSGFNTVTRTINTDFVLNESIIYSGNDASASETYETIPFQLEYGSAGSNDSSTLTFQWRPDPALYLAVLCGQFQVVITDSSSDAPFPAHDLNIAVMVSGWKSVMGNPDKKRRSMKRRKK